MTDSQISDTDPSSKNGRGRSPRYDQVRRWAEYIQVHPPEVWGPQQNAVVNGQLESAQAVGVSAAERARIRKFADEVLRVEAEGEETDEAGSKPGSGSVVVYSNDSSF